MQWVIYNPLPTRKDGSSIGTEQIVQHVQHDNVNIEKDATYYESNNSGNNRYFEISPVLPLGMLLIISTVIFILIIFRRWPGLVAGIIAGTLTSVSIYLTLLAIREPKLVYE